MGRYATGKKSKAISDITGFKVNYPQLKTTWDNLRVEPEEFDIKHPQLTPAKNIFDATALFNPRPDTDQEITNVILGYNYNIFTGKLTRPSIGVSAKGDIGKVGSSAPIEFESAILETGIEATMSIGTFVLDQEIGETGEQASGAVGGVFAGTYTYTVTVQSVDGANKYFIDGVQQPTLSLVEGQTYIFDWSAATSHPFRFSTTSNGTHGSGSEYTTGVTKDDSAYTTQITVASGAPTLYYYCSVHSAMGETANTPATSNAVVEVSPTATQASATAEVGSESLVGNPVETGVEATGEVGTETPVVSGWGQEGWGERTWGL